MISFIDSQSARNMNFVSNIHSPHRGLSDSELRRAEDSPKPARLPGPTKISESRYKKQTTVDARISSLKVLALSLLNKIESLQEEVSSDTVAELDLQAEIRNFEAELIRNALISTGGRQRRAAHLLGMKVTTLNTKIKRYGIQLHEANSQKEISSEISALNTD